MKSLTRTHIAAFALALGATALAHAQTQAPGLQVAQEGTISATLESGTVSRLGVTLFFDTLGGLSVNNPQDRVSATTFFNSSTQVGTTVTIAPTSPIGGQNLNLFPGGTAIQLAANDGTQVPSATGFIGKDVPPVNPNAQVTFGADNTASVTFLSSGGSFTLGLTNVVGLGGGGGGGCRI